MNKIKIFIADDHAILREGLKYIIHSDPRYEVIGESGDGRNALERIEYLKPHVAILDISMPLMIGIEVARQLRKYHPEIKLIMLSQYDNDEYIKQVVSFGIHGYILKENAGHDLLRAIDEVMNNNIYFSPGITKNFVNVFSREIYAKHKPRKSLPCNDLSSREVEILKLIAEGNSNIQIASLLFISDKTVNVHRANIMKKLNVHKIADIVKYAFKNKLVECIAISLVNGLIYNYNNFLSIK